MVRFSLVLVALLLAEGVAAGEAEVDAPAIALKAQETKDRYCSAAAGDNVTTAAESVAAVGAVWAEVSAALESTRKLYLLYWRGVLGQCLDQEAKALGDLKAFVAASARSESLPALVEDAERRIRRLEGQPPGRASPPTPGRGALIGGTVLGVAAGALGGLGGWQYGRAESIRQQLYDGEHIGLADVDARVAAESAATNAHRGLVIGASATGATAVALLIAGGAGRDAAARVAVVPWLEPAERGLGSVGLAVGGRW